MINTGRPICKQNEFMSVTGLIREMKTVNIEHERDEAIIQQNGIILLIS